MIKFEFTLNDVDASNLVGILHDAKIAALHSATSVITMNMSDEDHAKLDWFNSHAEYLEGLKQKVLAGNHRTAEVVG
jgi:hypothetical protein